jgi:N6-L-threonylcarbamoyladenine synthase
MRILGIETSCDETAAAVVSGENNHLTLLSNTLATSLSLHAQTGGVIPENAAREQLKYILPVIQKTLSQATMQIKDIDALAVTYGPGLIGSLLVGVETIRTLSFVLNKPIIPVNHMLGHIYANFISVNSSQLTPNKQQRINKQGQRSEVIQFPTIALVVSGGHTDLLLLKAHGDYQLLGGTRDDAAGEAFDKIGRLLGLSYPAGPAIEKLAKEGDPHRFHFPRPLINSDDYDFSFSGLKTAVLREVIKLKENTNLDAKTITDLCRATQDAIIEVLVKKTCKAVGKYHVRSILLSGGVAANQTLREQFEQQTVNHFPSVKIFAPAKFLCTDNAAMIAAAAYYNYKPVTWKDLIADPELYFDSPPDTV